VNSIAIQGGLQENEGLHLISLDRDEQIIPSCPAIFRFVLIGWTVSADFNSELGTMIAVTLGVYQDQSALQQICREMSALSPYRAFEEDETQEFGAEVRHSPLDI
jgi:hypothetical protein